MKPNIKVRKSTIPEVPDTFHDTSIKFNQSLRAANKRKINKGMFSLEPHFVKS
jgi:hypothetical protein